MQRPLLVFLFFFTFCFSVRSQTLYSIKGVVLDAENKEQLIGATVSIEAINRNTQAGLDGSYSLANLKSGTYKLRCRFLGNQTKDTTIVLNGHIRLNFLLKNTAAVLNNVEIAGKTNRETDASVRKHEQNADNVVNLISARAIQLSPDITVANVIQRVSGVSLERSGNGEGRYAIIRGMDKRYNYTLINGIKVPSPDNKNRYVPLDIFPSDLVERIEISKTLTPDMEGDAIGGVVNMVMKNAPEHQYLNASISTGANQHVFNHGFNAFPVNAINRKSPYEINGPSYLAKPEDFTRDNLNYTGKSFRPNLLANLSIGNRFLGQKLGVMLGGSYQNTYRSYTNIFVPGDQYLDQANAPGVLLIKHASSRDYSTQVTRIGLNAKVDYRFNDKNKISAYAFHAILDDAQARLTRDSIQTPPREGYGTAQVSYFGRSKYQHQSITNTTIDGQHTLIPGLKFNWIGAYSIAKSNIPDLAEYGYDTGFYADGTNPNPYQHPNKAVDYHRIWENNSDKDLSGYANLAYTNKLMNIPFTLTGGAMYRNKKRNNLYQDYLLKTVPNNDGTFQEWTNIYDFKWSVSNPDGSPENANTYRATEDVTAGFGMLKFKLNKFETLLGLRVENTKQHYDNDLPVTQAGKTGDKSYSDLLPSINIKYILNQKTNLRLSYFASINRPSFYELVPAPRKGDEYNETGNPELKHATADNFDIRYELFPKSNEQILIGAFYKKIHNPIEFGFINDKFDTYAPQNFGDATNFGFELVYEKYIRNFGFRANYTYTNSAITTTKFQTINKQIVAPLQKRPLQGQSKNIANAALLYKSVKQGIDVQLAWQYTGERIAVVSPYYELDQWQKGASTFDFSAEKRFKNHLAVFVKVQNLLNTPDEMYIKQPPTGNAAPVSYQTVGSNQTLASKSSYGQNYQLGLRYTL
ncbi:TonB-dependent receptor [Pedobacter gandavensis]|uniref:Outer membrane beta-barrel protein n=1 Tax=Pedobacter gandavensis TaxID=2679963 RepID=A0ABR6ESP8_9SPHI|nr:TonB-dependent receptor [Pedobacter gandavensis]MBB2148077.1 outer membrane beta-barrel protein [Pedobacter gandavensis]